MAKSLGSGFLTSPSHLPGKCAGKVMKQDEFRQWLVAQGLTDTTASSCVGIAKRVQHIWAIWTSYLFRTVSSEKLDLTEVEKSLQRSAWQVSGFVGNSSSIGKGAVMNSTMRAVLVVSCLLLPTASFSQTQEMDVPIVYSSPEYKQAYTALAAGDYETAVRFYNLAGENGVPPAYFELGLMYLDGKGVPQNDAEAARLIELSARLNYPHAQAKLGVMYYNGQGLTQNTETAYMWLDVGFKNGSSVAGENRDKVATVMNPTQITSAKQSSDVCRASALKDCD